MSIVASLRRFERIRCLGEGGAGVVYEALDRERGTRVALKMLRHVTAESLTFLKREFRAMQDVHHPNLASLGELVYEGDECFFTMELVEGVDWLEYVQASRSLVAELPPTGSDRGSALTRAVSIAGSESQPRFDEERLRDALRQLAEVLTALHGSGLVHRDVKPSNVRVTHDGRVVLLDFGLVVLTNASNPWTQEAAGTPAYMAPEQVGTAAVGPEADWYAVGTLLFEALTGTLPFTGPALDVMMRKQREQPQSPSAAAPGVPPDLDALCNALMQVSPSARPKGQDVLRVLGAVSASQSRRVWGSQTQAVPFVGRVEESQALLSAFRASRVQPVTVLVEGESGVGKTALVRQFLQKLSHDMTDVVILAGRCYERESVPYKAFDGVVDALGRVLSRIPNEEAQGIVPTKPGPLVKVFPVLRRVAAVAERVRGAQPLLQPLELRARAFAALRELFTRLGDRRPLVVAIDDAQWADPDSLALLAELMRPPEAPSLLLVMTARAGTSAADRNEFIANGDRQRPTLASTMQWEVRRIELGPLPPRDANALASQLLDRAGVTDPRVAAWSARQAGGHPLFIDMMTRQATHDTNEPSGKLKLEDALAAVIGQLGATPRSILETVSAAGAPIAQETVARATGVEGDAFAKAVSLLRVSHMVQTRGARDSDSIEPYHDRVRTAVLALLDQSRRADVHRRLALALEADKPLDAESLIIHWRGAGNLEQAAHYAVLAGDRAAEALAFDPAATFYELALTRKDLSATERQTLLVKLAEARANAGRGEAAADAFRKAAQGAGAFEALELRRREAEELLMAGDIDAGAKALRQVLAAVGMRAPRSRLAKLLWLLAYSVLQAIIGLRFKERTRAEVPLDACARIAALLTVARGFAAVDPLLSRCMSKRHLITALRVGDTLQVLLAAAFEMSNAAIGGGPVSKREQHLTAIAQRLADRGDTWEGMAFFRANLGISLYLRGEWAGARENLDLTLSATASRSAGRQSNTQVFAAWTLMFLGEYRELARWHTRLLADAEVRGDLYTSVQLRDGYLAVLWLAADNPETARRTIRDALAQWSQTAFLLQHWHAMYGETDIELYLGDGARAYERCATDLPAIEKSLLLKCQHIRICTTFTRGRCAIASANEAPRLRRHRLAEARRMIRSLECEVPLYAALFASLLSAAVSNAEGDRSAAVASLRMAIRRGEAANMAMHSAAARYQLGSLIGNDEGNALVQKGEAAMIAQDVRAPARFARMWLPGRWKVE
jgi:eukaryotic-like serine/threonine-protein kinase